MASSSHPAARVHRRQFVLGPRAHTPAANWRTVDLGESLVLSADPELRVRTATDQDGRCWSILGTAVDTRPEFADPLEEIARRPTREIEELHQGWAGRWVLIGNSSLHPDGTAMLSCYYGRNINGEVWVSSSPVLIQQALGLDTGIQRGTSRAWVPRPDATATGAVRGISWFPPPQWGVAGVQRLLPSQVLSLRSGVPRPRRLTAAIAGDLSDEELLVTLGVSIRTAVTRLASLSSPDEPTLLLSGGRDSRLLLSMAISAGLRLRTFTRIHRRASLADRILPPRLARVAGYPHCAHRQKREVPGRRRAILDHAGYNVSWLSAEEFLEGGSDTLTGIVLIGLVGALGRDRFLPDVEISAASGRMIAEQFDEDSPNLIHGFDAWLKWRRDHPDPKVDLSDCFFLEQRTAGRKGAKEQICDLFGFERLPPLNSAHIFGLILALSPDVQRQALWITSLIEAATPDLLRDPMNPPDDYFGIVRKKLSQIRAYRRRMRRLSRGNRSFLRPTDS
jgi:hypothetical protein